MLHFLKRNPIKIGILLLLILVWLFCLPSNLFKEPTSTVLKSREGLMLGARIADDGQWRFPKQDSVSHRFEKCILNFEDEYFYWHPGFNPIAISKALWENLTTHERRGGSTLTQQVIRLARKNQKRTYWEKLIEIFQATRLEFRSSKKEILNLYTTNAPFGGNVVGLETASWRYFGISSEDLSWGQAAALAVLPNAPSLIFPGKNEKILKEKRDRLLLKLFKNKIIDETTYDLALAEKLPGKPLALPEIAPHLTEKLRNDDKGTQLTSTIPFTLQQQMNEIARKNYENLRQNEIHNLSILILDVNTREVLAYVGNSPTTAEHNHYVDIIQRPRSTGSILKPFLYAAMLDEGTLLPNSLVADVPTSINGYQPQNFDKKFNGAVPANVALARSLNVPAVRMLQDYGLQKFYHKLQKIQLKDVNKSAGYYGLSLILGGAESSLWNITTAYAGMASTLNHFNASSSEYYPNEFLEPIYHLGKKVNFGDHQFQPEVFQAGAIYHTLKTLEEVNRPTGEENWNFFSHSQAISWKTGTSYGFKDAWAVGLNSKFVVGVWVGNADGEGRPGLTGLQAAAPILFEAFDKLPKASRFNIPYDELIEAEVCTQSGHLAGIYCDKVKKEWIPKNGTRTEACPYHKQVFLDESEQFQVNSSCYEFAAMKATNWFSLPPIMEYYYASKHPEYKNIPPFKSGCLKEGEQLMQFIYPKRNEAILLPKNFKEQTNPVVFKLAHHNPNTTVYWYLDKKFITTTQTFHELLYEPEPGKHSLTATDQEGNSITQEILIEKN
ncbi:penicillin-binding protein 1C [Mesonia aestuariivivens]|uniref:Penicillin-binding protein 1C n=1 Tax=Mesonia aestuariivivens TaxID=2796128 RepID=A0ABS6VXA6_9FLAO|nr:penicillin-binding protein 1C [Mesonia aestuariivivens]MBW2960233.1 penicillin-binding protein 1C [Mesonia aestuariivivens]